MSIEEIISNEVRKAVEPLKEQIDALTAQLAPLQVLSDFILLRQKDVPAVGGVSPRTVSDKISKGDVDILSRDGSSKHYLTLTDISGLKVRKGVKKERNRP